MVILQYPDPSLRTVCKAVEKVTPELQATAKEMYKVMLENSGIGLAANQVGLDITLLVLNNNGEPLYMFNPKTMKQSADKRSETESCLSFIGQFESIKRSIEVTVKYRDINNKMQFVTLRNLAARAYLHEADHLRGVVFTDLI